MVWDREELGKPGRLSFSTGDCSTAAIRSPLATCDGCMSTKASHFVDQRCKTLKSTALASGHGGSALLQTVTALFSVFPKSSSRIAPTFSPSLMWSSRRDSSHLQQHFYLRLFSCTRSSRRLRATLILRALYTSTCIHHLLHGRRAAHAASRGGAEYIVVGLDRFSILSTPV